MLILCIQNYSLKVTDWAKPMLKETRQNSVITVNLLINEESIAGLSDFSFAKAPHAVKRK